MATHPTDVDPCHTEEGSLFPRTARWDGVLVSSQVAEQCWEAGVLFAKGAPLLRLLGGWDEFLPEQGGYLEIFVQHMSKVRWRPSFDSEPTVVQGFLE
jgi:hypothetical protein